MNGSPTLKTIKIIAGPTAGGKSARAIAIATAQNGVIINCDSLQIYDALPILTAQPSPADKQTAPHALYGHLDPNTECSAMAWRDLAILLITEALSAGQTPIICGGTGFYIKALTDGLSPMPTVPQEIRQRGTDMIEDIGRPAFHAMLEKCDPMIKGRFHPSHSARLLRAWEVLEATGKSITYWQSLPLILPPEGWVFETEIIIPDRKTLYERCDRRLEMMLENGALDEVKALTARIENGEIKPDAPITKALGFKPLQAHLNGTLSLDEAIAQSQTDTRNYAKRQTTWFKNQMGQ